MNHLLRPRTGFTLLLFGLLGVIMGFTFLDSRKAGTCNGRAETVLYTKSLERERLAQLYTDMKALYLQAGLPDGGYDTAKGLALPAAFADLQVMNIVPQETKIVVENCPGYFVHLNFLGINPQATEPSEKLIVVRWGDSEGLGEEVLWRGQ